MKEIKSFLDLAEYILKLEDKELNETEIWDAAEKLIANGEIKFQTTGKTPWSTISSRIYMDIKENPEKTKFIRLIKPRRFILKSQSSSLKQSTNEINESQLNIESESSLEDTKTRLLERELHEYLTLWNFKENNIYTKTIFHESSQKNKGKARGLKDYWLYPDMVGVKFAFEYGKKIIDFASKIAFPLVKLYSYELKLKITPNNVRACYFQAVSNSSWANEGYLVVNTIEGEPSLMNELIRLNNAFGIGVILLKTDNQVLDSEILLPAHKRDIIDIETLNILTQKNPDFEIFMDATNDRLGIKRSEIAVFDKLNEELLNIYS